MEGRGGGWRERGGGEDGGEGWRGGMEGWSNGSGGAPLAVINGDTSWMLVL